MRISDIRSFDDILLKIYRWYGVKCVNAFPDRIKHWVHTQWPAYRFLSKFASTTSSKYIEIQPVGGGNFERTVWMYWNQGEENAPEIVRKCIASARKYCPEGYNVRVLTVDDAKSLASLPDFVWEAYNQGKIKQAMFSDLLRLSLLCQYGGIWADATVLWTDVLPEDIMEASFFMFKSPVLTEYASPIKCSNWFIKSDRNNALLLRLRDLMLQYIERYNVLIHYYIFHLTLATLVNTDRKFAAIWDEVPYFDNNSPHVMQMSLSKEYTERRWNNLLRQGSIHKLTYKYSKDLESEKQNVLNHILNM